MLDCKIICDGLAKPYEIFLYSVVSNFIFGSFWIVTELLLWNYALGSWLFGTKKCFWVNSLTLHVIVMRLLRVVFPASRTLLLCGSFRGIFIRFQQEKRFAFTLLVFFFFLVTNSNWVFATCETLWQVWGIQWWIQRDMVPNLIKLRI